MAYSKEEQETSLVRDGESGEWLVYSSYQKDITKLVKTYGIENWEPVYEDGRESPISLKGKLESNQVSFRKGGKRVMTEEDRLARAERMRNLHKNKKGDEDS